MKAAVELGGRGGRTVGWVSGGGGGGAGGGGTDPLSDMPLSLRQLSRRMRDGLGGCEGRFPLSGRTGAEVARWGWGPSGEAGAGEWWAVASFFDCAVCRKR